MKRTSRNLNLAAIGPVVLEKLLAEATARDGVRLGRPSLEFREVVNHVTAVPESCRLPNGQLDVAAFLAWFCPTLDPDEAWRLSRLPSCAAIKLEAEVVRAFVELHAYRSDMS